MSDLDCGSCDCGNCDCGNCDCGDCKCDCSDCKCDCSDFKSDCCCCFCCDNDPSGGSACCNDVNCNFCSSWCMAETMMDVAEDIDHSSDTRTHNQRRKRAQQETGQVGEQPVTTQPGVDPSVITLQPTGEPPSYEAATQGEIN